MKFSELTRTSRLNEENIDIWETWPFMDGCVGQGFYDFNLSSIKWDKKVLDNIDDEEYQYTPAWKSLKFKGKYISGEMETYEQAGYAVKIKNCVITAPSGEYGGSKDFQNELDAISAIVTDRLE